MGKFTNKSLSVFRDAIPPARFQTYLDAGGSLDRAVALYLWNMEAASAVTQMSGLVEVLFRDTIDQNLRAWNCNQGLGPEWIINPAVPLQHIVRKTPHPDWCPTPCQPLWKEWWEARSECHSQQPNHHDLVAGLSFGTWTSLLPHPNATSNSNARLSVWNNALSAGFANEPKEAVYRWSHEVRHMRNRASHLRPMLDTDRLMKFHRYSIRLLRSINEDFGQIVAGFALIPNVIKSKPF